MKSCIIAGDIYILFKNRIPDFPNPTLQLITNKTKDLDDLHNHFEEIKLSVPKFKKLFCNIIGCFNKKYFKSTKIGFTDNEFIANCALKNGDQIERLDSVYKVSNEIRYTRLLSNQSILNGCIISMNNYNLLDLALRIGEKVIKIQTDELCYGVDVNISDEFSE